MSHQSILGDSFKRSLIENNCKILSVCQTCGTRIVASVTEGLQDRELEHLEHCISTPRAEAPSAAEAS